MNAGAFSLIVLVYCSDLACGTTIYNMKLTSHGAAKLPNEALRGAFIGNMVLSIYFTCSFCHVSGVFHSAVVIASGEYVGPKRSECLFAVNFPFLLNDCISMMCCVGVQ